MYHQVKANPLLAHIDWLTIHRAFINQYFSIRSPGIELLVNVAQMLAFPAGKLLEVILPSRQFTTFGYTWSFNPGKFNLKEHIVITIMANVGLSIPYTSNVRGRFSMSPVHDQSPVVHLGPALATLLQPGIRWQLRISEYVTLIASTPIGVYGLIPF